MEIKQYTQNSHWIKKESQEKLEQNYLKISSLGDTLPRKPCCQGSRSRGFAKVSFKTIQDLSLTRRLPLFIL